MIEVHWLHLTSFDVKLKSIIVSVKSRFISAIIRAKRRLLLTSAGLPLTSSSDCRWRPLTSAHHYSLLPRFKSFAENSPEYFVNIRPVSAGRKLKMACDHVFTKSCVIKMKIVFLFCRIIWIFYKVSNT
jgi:hypothetical protein